MVGESQGFMRVAWGPGILARILAWMLGFPRPSSRVAVRLEVRPVAGGLRWVRHMGVAIVTTTQRESEGLLLESFGPVVCAFRLLPEPRGFRYEQQFATIGLGRWRLR